MNRESHSNGFQAISFITRQPIFVTSFSFLSCEISGVHVRLSKC